MRRRRPADVSVVRKANPKLRRRKVEFTLSLTPSQMQRIERQADPTTKRAATIGSNTAAVLFEKLLPSSPLENCLVLTQDELAVAIAIGVEHALRQGEKN